MHALHAKCVLRRERCDDCRAIAPERGDGLEVCLEEMSAQLSSALSSSKYPSHSPACLRHRQSRCRRL